VQRVKNYTHITPTLDLKLLRMQYDARTKHLHLHARKRCYEYCACSYCKVTQACVQSCKR